MPHPQYIVPFFFFFFATFPRHFIITSNGAFPSHTEQHQGLYRLAGQKSRILKLYVEGVEKAKSVNFDDEELMTVTSALKHVFREMKEPLLSFQLFDNFIMLSGE